MIKTAIIVSDLHAPFHDVEALSSVRKLLKEFQPNYFIINGDAYDFYGISRFNKNPLRTQGGLQRELDIGYIMLKWLVSSLQKTKTIFIEGNHEERWNKFLQSDQNLFTLRALSLTENMRVNELNIEYHKESMLLHGLLIKHGTYFNLHTANKELNVEGVSGTSGHIHRLQMIAKTFRDRQHVWCTTGHMVDITKIDYMQSNKKTTNHQQSFLIAYFDTVNDIIQLYPILLTKKSFIWNNKVYVPTSNYIKEYNKLLSKLPEIDKYYGN